MKNKQINFLVTLQIPINLEQERNRIAKINKSKYPYTKKETAKLLKLFSWSYISIVILNTKTK